MVTAQERARYLAEKVADQRLKSPVFANADSAGVDHWDTGNQCGVDSKPAIQHSEAGAGISAEGGAGGLPGTGAQVALCNRNVIGVEDVSGNGAQLSLRNDNGTGAQTGGESGTGAHLRLKSGIPEQVSDGVSTAVTKDSVCRDSEAEPRDDVDNQPQKSISGETSIRTQPKESNPSPSNCAKEPTSSLPSRPKEPFCRVLSRDGTRVLLWPSEMVSYTKTSPSISFSINPLLYDFRAHNRAREGGEEKKGGLEEARERIKPPVIKQPDCQQRQEVTEGGREGKIDEREEDDEGGQAGNPMELVGQGSGCNAVPDDCGWRDESALKFVPVSTECHLAPTLGLQKKVRRRGKRGGRWRGMRKRGRRKRGREKDWERGRRIMSSLSENQVFEGRGEERLKREVTEKEEERKKGLLSNLVAHRLVGEREKMRMRPEERRIRGDQTERERAGRNDKKRGELLSNLPMNRCNRCNQLCLQVKREASQHQSQQSASGWGQGLRKLLCRGAACNSVISPVPGSVIQMPCRPAITPDTAQNDRETPEIQKNTQAGKEDGRRDEERGNLRKTEIRAVRDAKENVCNLVISRVAFPCRETAHEPEMCLFTAPQRETACDPAISLVPAPFRETACSQRQTIPAGHSNPAIGPASRCSAQQTGTQPRIRSACADMTLPCDAISKEGMSKRAATAEKRKTESQEAEETPRKRRRRGRRHARRAFAQRQKCVGLGVDEASCTQDSSRETGTLLDNCLSCNTTEKNSDCHFLCRTKHSEGTFGCSTTDGLNNYCRCEDSEGVSGDVVDCSQLSSDPPGGEEKTCDTGDTPSDHSLCEKTRDEDENRGDSGICGATNDNQSCDRDMDLSPDPPCNTVDEPVDVQSKDFFTCSTNDTPADHCQYENKQTEKEKMSADSDNTTGFSGITAAQSFASNTTEKFNDFCNPSDSAIDCKTSRGIDQSVGLTCDDIDGGRGDYLNGNCVADCNHCADVDKGRATNATEIVALVGTKGEEEGDVKRQRQKEEEQIERRKAKEKQEEWGKEWLRRKEREREDRERRKEMDFELVYPEKRPCFPRALPPHCIPLHAPLLLPPSLSTSSSSSSFSFHHTFIQHHLSLLPPPSHLPVHPYPHLLPSFSTHLSPLALNPPPAPPPPPPPPPPLPPSFYASSHIPLLDASGPYPLAAAFHPLQSHHPSLYPPHHPAVLPLQMLFQENF